MKRISAIALIVSLFLISCGQSTTAGGADPSKVLEITRNRPVNNTPIHVTVKDDKTIDNLLTDIHQMPDFPRGAMSCPIDWGIAYHLVFKQGDATTLDVTANPAGCRIIDVGNRHLSTSGKAGTDFWDTLQQTLGLTSDELMGRPTQGAFVPLPDNPSRIDVQKNGNQKTIVDPAEMKTIVDAINNQGKLGSASEIHCLAYANVHLKLTIAYPNGTLRTFTNDGGGCVPLVDVENGYNLQLGTILSLPALN